MSSVALKRGEVRKRPAARRAPSQPAVRRIAVPISAAVLRRNAIAAFSVLALVAGVVVITLLGLPQQWWMATAQAAGRAGFEVKHVEVSGVHKAPKLPVYAAALDGPTNSMLLVDLDAVRDRLRALPWVADASVSRRLPDTLRVTIVERAPMALWQFQHKLAVIDRSGTPLTRENLESYAKLPLVVGPGANTQAHDLLVLLATEPEIAAKVDAATLVGSRRWDIRFKSGETLALPEGRAAAAKALASFAKLNNDGQLLDRGFARFDMRLPGRMTVRVHSDAGSATPAPREMSV
ncbi:MAG TPA: FtsQ-type POTRA domain-containing protein [Polymorphobacter sp.]|nr:FtsQ-type POTRA domain-containing protein [Polymorphobacter sp.]